MADYKRNFDAGPGRLWKAHQGGEMSAIHAAVSCGTS